MQNDTRLSFRAYLPAALTLVFLGWGAVLLAVLAFPPTVWARWLLFFGGTLGLIGLALPGTWFLNLRFPSDPPAGVAVILRQAIWVGVYGVLLAWLQQARLVSLWSGLGLAGGLVAIEYLIRMREKARWSPPLAAEPPTAAALEANPGGDPPDQPNG
jgi:hypothetical protein